jgi:hypothetical protein
MRIILTIGIVAIQLAAQSITEPPLLVQLIRRPGIDASIPPYAGAGAAIHVFGMTSITGPAETWLLETHNSFGSIEDVNEAVRSMPDNGPGAFGPLSGDVLAESRALIAVYRPAFSYRPDQAARMLPRTRYFSVSLYRMRLGGDAEFADLLRTRKDFFDSINLDRPEMAYQVISGASSTTYLLLAPLTSLRSLDEGLGRRSVRGESRSAGAAGNKSGAEIELSRAQLLFRLQPQLSYVSDEFAAELPEFWRQKPAQR